jgi:hypothetical protein
MNSKLSAEVLDEAAKLRKKTTRGKHGAYQMTRVVNTTNRESTLVNVSNDLSGEMEGYVEVISNGTLLKENWADMYQYCAHDDKAPES